MAGSLPTACRSPGSSNRREWHDGQPFTADDVVFNWEYASDPATAATTIGIYQDVEVEKVDTYLPCAFASRNRRRSGQVARML